MTRRFGTAPAADAALRRAGETPAPPRGPAAPAIATRKLTKAYGARRALRALDLAVQPGERLALVGPNGAGKSTLLRLLALLTRPTSGSITIRGLDAERDAQAVRACLGVMLHESLLYPDLTVRENLHFFARLYRVRRPTERIEPLLARLGLDRLGGARVRELSRGQRQRASLARALVHDPPLLLFDEPDTGLDARSFELVQAELVRAELLQAELAGAPARTLVFASHDPLHALALGSRLILLQDGRGSDLGEARRWTAPELTALLLAAATGPLSDQAIGQ